MAITAEARTSIIKLVVGMFGAAPGANVLSALVAAYENGATLQQLAAGLATKSQFATLYPNFLTNQEFADRLANNLLGNEVTAAVKTSAATYVVGRLNAGATRAQVISEAITLIDNAPSTGNYANAALAFDNKVEVATYYSVTKAQSDPDLADLQSVIKDVTSVAGTVTTAKATVDGIVVSNSGGIFALSANADVLGPNSVTEATKTTAGDDTIYANTDASLSGADIVDGGGGVDTLYSVQDVGAAETLTPILTNVEKVFVDVNDTTAGTATTFTFSGATSTGLKEVWVNAYSGSTTGNEDTFAITNVAKDVATGIKGGDGEFHVTTTYNSTTGTSDTATLALDTASVDTVTIAGIETLNIATSGADKSTSTIATLTVAAAKALNISGARGLTITNNVDFADATDTLAFDGTVDASGMSGNLTVVLGNTGDNVKFTGGSGKNNVTTGAGNDNLTGGAANDTFTLGTGNDTVVGGAGDDRVNVALASLTTDDSITLGDGARDSLILTATTDLSSGAINAAALELINKVSGAEIIGSSAAVTNIDAGYFTQSIFQATAALTAALTVSNVAGDTLIINGGITGVNGDALTLTGALPNQTATIELNGAASIGLQATDGAAGNTALTIASGISTVNLVSATTATTPSTVTNTITNAAATTATHVIDNASAGSFKLTGSVNLTIGSGLTAGFTKAVDFDASAFTGKLSIVGSTEADIIKGGSGVDTINGDDGDDILTGGAGADTFVFISGDGSAAPSTSVFETITDYAKGVDIIDWDATLTIDTATAAAVATVAQVNDKGIATFHSDDDTLAERIVAASKGLDADGDFVVFEFGGDSYVIISGDANATQDAPDALIKLTGVTGLTSATVDGNGNITLA